MQQTEAFLVSELIASKPRLVFVFPYRGVGGVPVLFFRVGECLRKSNQAEVYYVDYPDGGLSKLIAENQEFLLPYSDTKKTIIPQNSIVIMQSLTPWSIYPQLEIPPSSRLFFWTCHPLNFVPVIPGMNINMIATPWVYKMICWTVLILWALQSRRFALFLLKKNALIFMDEPTYRGSEYLLNIRVPNPKTARIPAPEARGCQELMRPVGQVINCVWVGRLADFKISILIYLSASLERYNQQNGKRVKLTVIGSGPKEAELRQNVAELANLTVDFISDLGLGELNLYLQNHTDILFAMGTSALEGAASGVPTVLLDFSYKKVPEGYVYRWLHDTEGSSLGDWISSANIRSGNQSLATIMIELQTNTQELKKKTLEYVQKYHDLKTVSRQILDFSVKTEASYQSLVQEGLFKQGLIYSLLRRIRSIRNKRNV